MIVTCTGCATRFRVADEKVGPKGARLRCTRCKIVFNVSAPAGAAPVEPPPAAAIAAPPPPPRPEPADDPFALAARAAEGADPFLALGPPPAESDPFLLATPPPAGGETDDPFATAALRDAPDGNFAVAAGLQIPAPEVAPPPPPAWSPAAAPGADALALEEPEPRPPPPPVPDALPPPPAPGLLDFGSYDFGDEPLAAPPAPAALPPAPAADGSVDPLAGLSLDDLDGASAPPATPGPAPTPAPVLAAAPEPEPIAAPAPAQPAPAAPPRAPARVPERAPDAPRRGVRLGSLGLNLLSLAALLVVAGAIYASAARRSSGALFAKEPPPLAVEAVSSALYDTAAGKPVLVVRGQVRSALPQAAAARVEVELVDGGRVVARGRALAGAGPTPEEVHAVDGAAAAERLAAGARPPARLARGESAPFTAVVADLPPGPERLSVRVTVAPAP